MTETHHGMGCKKEIYEVADKYFPQMVTVATIIIAQMEKYGSPFMSSNYILYYFVVCGVFVILHV